MDTNWRWWFFLCAFSTCLYQATCDINIRLDSALYEFAPLPAKGQRGRHREKGERVTSLTKLVLDSTQSWHDICIDWYGGITKNVRLLSDTHLWYSSGEKPLPIRWVLVVDPEFNGNVLINLFICYRNVKKSSVTYFINCLV